MVLNSHSDNQNGFRSASRIQELVLHSQIQNDCHLDLKGRFDGNLRGVAGWHVADCR